MKTIKRLVAIALAVLMIFGSFSMAANAWDANVDDGKTLSITTKIFRLVDGTWTETEKVKQGEEVRARIYLDTDYYTNSGNLLFFYNNDFFTDSFGADTRDITVNSYYSQLPYGIKGTFVGDDSDSDVEAFMVGNGKITTDFANTHGFAYISYKFDGGVTNKKFDGSQWLFEIPLTVRADAAAGTGIGDFFAVEETTRSTTFKKGRINVPKGPYDGTVETITGMSNWDATLVYESQPVTLYQNFVTVSFDAGYGTFADKSTTYYAEGDAGDALAVPNPTRTNYKFVGWKLKGADDSTAAEVTAFPAASGKYEAVWNSTTSSGEELTFVTKIYRQDPQTGEWIYTERVKPGEKVKARLFVNTSYFTNAGNIIMFYDSEFFTDGYNYNQKYELVPNTSTSSSAYANGVSGDFAKIDDSNYSLQDLVTYGYITQDFVDNHTAITARYQFTPSENKKISDDEWFIEFDLTVLDTASGMGEFFIVEDTIKNSGNGMHAYINIPLGEEGGYKEETTSMHLWDVNATVKSYPVYIDSTITLQANGGAFDAADASTFVIEGTIGETVDYSVIPELSRPGYTFKGWVDASIENPTEVYIIDLPSEMPYDDVTFKAFWTDDVEITFVINNEGSNINKTVSSGAPFEPIEDPEMEGNIFIGWSTDPTGANVTGLPDVYPTEDTIYYAIYDAKTYNVNYYVFNPVISRFELVNYGSVAYGDIIATVPGNYEAPEGYSLSKAYSDVTLSKEFVAGQKMPAAEVNIYYYLEEVIYDAVFMVDSVEYARVPVRYGDDIKAPEEPSKEGYVFAGWDPYVGTMDEAGKIYNAVWTPAEYTVTWVVQDGTYEEFVIAYGAEMEIPAEPDVEGYEFLGWSEDKAATAAGTVAATMPANDVTYYAVLKIKQYTITFNTDGGSPIAPITQDYGSVITAPADPTKTGHSFAGWDALPATMPEGGATVTALWTKNSYTVTWKVDGSVVKGESLAYGADIVAPADPEKDGYKFSGWTPAPEKTMPAYNVEYTATWTVEQYTATFDANGGTYADGTTTKTQKFDFGAAVTAPEVPTQVGYTFAGWEPALGEMPAADTTYKAVWTVGDAKVYTVEIYTMDTVGNYGEPQVETKSANVGEIIKVTATPGEGFYLDTNKVNVLEATIKADEIAVLKVYYGRNKYAITFNGNEGTVDGSSSVSADYYHGAEVVAPEAVREGYSLTGWNPALSTVAVAEATYDAQWEINKYTITFDSNGGSNVLPITQDYGTVITAPSPPVKEGYVFKGWADADGNGIPVTMPAKDVTVYATWEEDSFTASFDAGDGIFESTGESTEESDVTYGDDIVPPAEEPVKEGYDFGGWATPDAPETPVTDFGKMDADGAEFIAIWIKTDFTVTFYDYKPADGGPLSPDVKYAYATSTKQMGDTVAIPGAPSFEHYEFLGWSEVEGDKKHIVTADTLTMPASDYALYAIYEPIKVMLIPKNDTCTTVIDRAGGTVDDYDATTSQWYVYGLKEYLRAPELLDSYIDVSGDGRIELIYPENGLGGTWDFTGTGTVINVYDRMGTPDDTSDDILVESFHIIIFGDVNGDSCVQAVDATFAYDEAAGITSWSNPRSKNYTHYLVKAADITGDTIVDAVDGRYIGDHTIGIVRIDQVTGRLK